MSFSTFSTRSTRSTRSALRAVRALRLRAGAGRLLSAALLATLALALAAPTAALAHERRAVSGYDLVVGFAVEPAIEGEKNGLDLRISRDGTPVEQAQEALRFEVTHIQNGTTKAYPVRAVFGTPGRYTADFIPTLSGRYRFQITGEIDGTPIDETFESGPNTFGNVEPVAELQFPIAAPQPRELEGALRAAAEEAAAASGAARSARTLAYAGIALGALGLLSGAGAFMGARGRRN